jgi:two-component system chemotaxis response regulator CheY
MPRKRILIVDDDKSLQQLYRTALALAGFAVETADDGLGALQKIDIDPPHLIVLDLHMPCVDGLTVLSELRANSTTVTIPVVVVTGTDCPTAIADASETLRKPCAPDKLISAIEHHISYAAA